MVFLSFLLLFFLVAELRERFVRSGFFVDSIKGLVCLDCIIFLDARGMFLCVLKDWTRPKGADASLCSLEI